MNYPARRKALIASGCAFTMSAFGPWAKKAEAAELVYKIGTVVPAAHPLNVRLKQASSLIQKETDGRLEIKVFPDNQLGGASNMFSQLRSGALEFFMLSGANVLSSLVPKAAISGVGFAFRDSAQVFEALDGDLGALLRKHITAAGLVVQNKIWDNGFRQITSNIHPIRSPEDLKQFKIRVPVSKLWISLFHSLGASPFGLNYNELYSALQTKVFDGQENPLVLIYTSKLYEVQKYCAITNHMWDGTWLLGNTQAWNRLPSSAQEIFSRYMDNYALLQREDIAKVNSSLKTQLEAKGLVFNSTDPKPFQQALRKAGFYAQWKQTFGEEEWSLLEKVTGRLA